MAEVTASGARSLRRTPRFPVVTRSSLDQIRRALVPTHVPRVPPPSFRAPSRTPRFLSRFVPVRTSETRARRRRRARTATPPHSGDSGDDRAPPDYSTTREDIDTISPATPLETEF